MKRNIFIVLILNILGMLLYNNFFNPYYVDRKEYYADGKLKLETRKYFKDGREEIRSYFDNGQLQSETYITNGHEDNSRQKEYSKNGILLREFEKVKGREIKNYFYCNEKMEQVFVRWVPGEKGLVVRKYGELSLADEEVTLLKMVGLTGQLEIQGYSALGRECQRSRVVFIFKTLIQSPIELNLPEATSLIYIPRDDSWQKLPNDASTTDRTIKFELDKNNPKLMLGSSELESGGRQGESIYLGI